MGAWKGQLPKTRSGEGENLGILVEEMGFGRKEGVQVLQ